MQKRNNPFSTPKQPVQPVEEVKQVVQEEVEEQEEIVPVRRVQPVRQTQHRVQMEAVRNKFTATMDEDLRREIKVYCAQNGLKFSEFVEEACRNYLAKGSRR